MTARLTLCLVARDEERMLPGCLDSVRGAVDEVVVLDTGSRDRTRELARAAGALVVEWAWRDDFAAARNEALRHATGDWVLVLDADERLAPGGAGPLRAAAADPRHVAALLPLHDAARPDAAPADVLSGAARLGEPSWLLRLARRTPDLAWQGVVHEHVDGWLGRHGRAARTVPGAAIVHLGAAPEARARRGKDARNLALLEARCAADPRDATGHGFLALELWVQGHAARAAEAAERGWRAWLADRDQPVHRLALARMLAALARGDAGRAAETAALARRSPRDASDLAYLHGCALELAAVRAPDAGARRALALDAAGAFAEAEALGARPELDRCISGASSWLSAARRGSALLVAGEPAAARDAFDAALAARPALRDALLGRAEATLELGDAAGALGALEPLLAVEAGGRDGWILAAAAARALGGDGEARAFLGRALARDGGPPLSPHRASRGAALAHVLGVAA